MNGPISGTSCVAPAKTARASGSWKTGPPACSDEPHSEIGQDADHHADEEEPADVRARDPIGDPNDRPEIGTEPRRQASVQDGLPTSLVADDGQHPGGEDDEPERRTQRRGQAGGDSDRRIVETAGCGLHGLADPEDDAGQRRREHVVAERLATQP